MMAPSSSSLQPYQIYVNTYWSTYLSTTPNLGWEMCLFGEFLNLDFMCSDDNGSN